MTTATVTPARGFLAQLRQTAYTVAARAMLLAHRATAAARRAVTSTGATIARIVALPTATNRTTVGTVALSLMILLVVAAIVVALTRTR